MATQATLDKLDALIDEGDGLTAKDLRFILKYWDDAPRRLHRNVITSLKAMERIPAALQLQVIDVSDKAARAIGDLLAPEAQDMILKEYPEDLPVIWRNLTRLNHIADSVWVYLAKAVAGDNKKVANPLKPRTVKALVARTDCPVSFAKAAGFTRDKAEKERIKASVMSKTGTKRTVKSRRNEDDGDDDFSDKKRVARAVRTVSRPRTKTKKEK